MADTVQYSSLNVLISDGNEDRLPPLDSPVIAREVIKPSTSTLHVTDTQASSFIWDSKYNYIVLSFLLVYHFQEFLMFGDHLCLFLDLCLLTFHLLLNGAI